MNGVSKSCIIHLPPLSPKQAFFIHRKEQFDKERDIEIAFGKFIPFKESESYSYVDRMNALAELQYIEYRLCWKMFN